MSWDCTLLDPITAEPLHAAEKHQMSGGTYAVGGTTELSLNVTYNYSEHYYRVLGEDGLMCLDGMSAAESLNYLQHGIDLLADDVTADYWESTEGNTKRVLLQLRALAAMRPDGIWRVE